MLNKRLIPLIGLTFAFAVAGIVMGFTLGSDSGNDEGIDPDECNYVHNFASCDGNSTLEEPPLPTDDDRFNDQQTEVIDTNRLRYQGGHTPAPS